MLNSNTYLISSKTNNKLVISLSKNNLFFGMIRTIVLSAIVLYFLIDQVDFTDISYLELVFCCLVAIAGWDLCKKLMLLLKGEEYAFNKTTNSVLKNGEKISQLDCLNSIRIFEIWNDDSANQFELQIDFKDGTSVSFRKTTDLGVLKKLGGEISSISTVPVVLVNSEDVRREQAVINEEIGRKRNLENLNKKIQVFEGKYENKSIGELEVISKADGPYADYAKEAARNLLKKREGSDPKSGV